jgi:2-polyprenyl-3-methyl-5-hydroxy-6-metoxy-1,4-benzoquinol methylase
MAGVDRNTVHGMNSLWDARATGWDQHLPSSDLFTQLLEQVMDASEVSGNDLAVDLGAGSGFITLPLADRTQKVYAVDASQKMLDQLRRKLDGSTTRVELVACDLREFTPPEKVDVVVSNYALHHLRHPAKRALLRRSHDWLRPGGRMVVSDLMVDLTLRPGQSAPLTRRLRSIASKGLPGYWRIGKNGLRWMLGRGEYPAGLDFWQQALAEAGFQEVGGSRVGSESGVVWGVRPPDSSDA